MFRYGGYVGRTLRVDISSDEIKIEKLQEELVEKYLGERGTAKSKIDILRKAGVEIANKPSDIANITKNYLY